MSIGDRRKGAAKERYDRSFAAPFDGRLIAVRAPSVGIHMRWRILRGFFGRGRASVVRWMRPGERGLLRAVRNAAADQLTQLVQVAVISEVIRVVGLLARRAQLVVDGDHVLHEEERHHQEFEDQSHDDGAENHQKEAVAAQP